jgi:hypothetical protein
MDKTANWCSGGCWFTLAPFAYTKQILQALYFVEKDAERGRKKSFSLCFFTSTILINVGRDRHLFVSIVW